MKIKKLIVISAVAVVSIVSNFAIAATTVTNLGALTSYNDGHQFGGTASPTYTGAFDDTYTFTLNSGTTFDALVTGWWGINHTGFTATLNGAPLSFSATSTPGTSYLALNNVTGSSSYSLHILGSADPSGASYNVALNSIVAVPEPETFAMLLAGLGLIGMVARRRNKVSTA